MVNRKDGKYTIEAEIGVNGVTMPFNVYISPEHIRDGVIVGNEKGMVPYSIERGSKYSRRSVHRGNLMLKK
jgi:hypothetical protein